MQELTNGRREHESLRLSYATEKRVITYKNLFLEAFRFVTRCFLPVIVPVHYAILYMIQSGEYMLSTDFVQNFKKVNYKESTSIWKIIWSPNQATLDDIMLIVFDPREFDRKVH
jgi:hypothetical protein